MSILFNNNTIKNIYVKTNQLSQEITKGYIKSDGALKQFYSKQNEGQEGLPNEYQRLQYIYNNSKAYINTGITGCYTYECKFKLRTGYYGSSGNKCPFTLNDSLTSNQISFYTSGSYTCIKYISETFNVTSDIGNFSDQEIILLYNINPDHTFKININNNIFSYVSTISNSIDRLNNLELILFGRNIYNTDNTNTISANAGFCIYNFKVYSDTTRNNLIANFIPCKRKSDEVIGMYNTLKYYLGDDGFYTNSGSGSLEAGPIYNS